MRKDAMRRWVCGSLAALPMLAGCAQMGPLKVFPQEGRRANAAFVDDAIKHGATSCRYNLEDTLYHALGDRKTTGVARYPQGEAARRPSTGLHVTTYANGDQAHLQWVVGPDGSGNCSVYWTETRYWPHSCEAVIKQHDRYAALATQDLGEDASGSILLVGDMQILLTPVSRHGCLVTESDIGWRTDPDDKARDWIKQDHGYDPGAMP
jgi:hypothetical protein